MAVRLHSLLLVLSTLLLLPATEHVSKALRCPDSCSHSTVFGQNLVCRCPDKNWTGSPCSWIGYGGMYSFPACLDAIPTNFNESTVAIFIKHLRLSTIPERSFPDSPKLKHLHIGESNISTVQPGAFRGLPLVNTLGLQDNRISSLEPDTFHGLVKVVNLNLRKNAISVISQHAFRGLPALTRLQLSMNRLRSMPVDALLPLKALLFASLVTNHITTIDSHVLRLSENQKLRLMIAGNELSCDGNLTWFICNLPDLKQISAPDVLRCASPADLHGILLATMRKDVCQTVTEMSRQGNVSGTRDGMSSTTGPCTINTSLYNAIPTEMLYTSSATGLEYTAGIDTVTLLGGPIVTEPNDSRHVNAIITAVIVPILLVLASAVVVYLYCCHGAGLAHQNAAAETDGSDKIEPYAVVYSNSAGLPLFDGDCTASCGGPTPVQDQTSEGNDDIQPYAVAYVDVSGKGKNGKLAPYATTSFAHIQKSEDNDDIEPYAVAYVDVSGKGKNGKLAPYATTSFAHTRRPQLQPYSVTHDDDPGPQLQPYSVTHDDDPGPQLQPYSVTHDDDPGPQLQPYSVTHDDDPGPQLQPYSVTHDDDPGPQLQPYSVTHDDDPGPQLQPYSVTHDDDPGQQLQPYSVTHDDDPGPQLQPYSVTHDDDPGPQLQPYSVTHDDDPGPQLQPYSVTHDDDPGPQLQPYSVTHDDDPGPQLQPYSVTHDDDPGPSMTIFWQQTMMTLGHSFMCCRNRSYDTDKGR
uniref:EGF-like domain-containing protein n=1 Tax=Branchiostoma floridae TaxID=7739 RepID=C3YJA4_BRAFL|eukprot:XP_002603591.1 hypothetical protein BRAFLDRAFT_93134 [Branchiostoma floridae]